MTRFGGGGGGIIKQESATVMSDVKSIKDLLNFGSALRAYACPLMAYGLVKYVMKKSKIL